MRKFSLRQLAMSSIFQEIRTMAAYVAQNSESVSINYDAITEYCQGLRKVDLGRQVYDESIHFRGDEEDTVSYILILDAVNFGSGFFPCLKKKAGFSGYSTVASSLTDFFRENGPITVDQLRQCNAEFANRIFNQSLNLPAMRSLMEAFAQSWRELGSLIRMQYSGEFSGLVRETEGNAGKLVKYLMNMPGYQDVHAYRGKRIPLLKRAQITVADLSLAFCGQGPGYFEDIDELTIFADNLVPHVLRMDGILSYSSALLNRIEEERLIECGSPQEIEIRACALYAADLIVQFMQKSGVQVNAMQLDHYLWNRGQLPAFKAGKRHRTRCCFY